MKEQRKDSHAAKADASNFKGTNAVQGAIALATILAFAISLIYLIAANESLAPDGTLRTDLAVSTAASFVVALGTGLALGLLFGNRSKALTSAVKIDGSDDALYGFSRTVVGILIALLLLWALFITLYADFGLLEKIAGTVIGITTGSTVVPILISSIPSNR